MRQVGKAGIAEHGGTDRCLETLYREFERHYALNCRARQQMTALRAELVGALEENRAPRDGSTRSIVSDFFAKIDGEEEQLRARGYFDLQASANAAMERAGQHAMDLFSLQANSLCGLLAKLRVLRRALGCQGAQEDGDEGLAAYQEDAPLKWFDSILRDLERLSGQSPGKAPEAPAVDGGGHPYDGRAISGSTRGGGVS